MRRLASAVAVGAFAVAGACAAPPRDEPVARSSSAITNGSPDDADPAVVAVRSAAGETFCTGTLVAPRVVVTAAHCLAGEPATVAFGADPAAPAETLRVLDARAHPAWDEATHANDVAALLLEAAPATASPAPLFAGGEALAPGVTVRLVGFGAVSPGAPDPPRKREGTALVREVTAETFTFGPTPSQTCGGDSGGPAFVNVGGTEALAGITSTGDAACADHAVDARIDAYRAFIDGYVASSAPGGAGAGERCVYDAQCREGTCRRAPDDARVAYCAPPCSAGCPEGMACDGDACALPVPSPGAHGAACAGAAECLDGVCARGPDGYVCTSRCLRGAPERCPDGEECLDDPDRPGAEACLRPPPTDGGCALARAGERAPRSALVALLAGLAAAAVARGRRR